MANGAESAVTQAARVSEIGFADFTTTLVREVFNALVASHLEQVQAHIAMTEAVANTLADYIVATKDAVSDDEAAATLAVAAAIEEIAQGVTLTPAQADTINDAVETPPAAGVSQNNRVANSGDIDSGAKLTALLSAAKVKIAANRFALLEQMVRQGALRLVVDNGMIETRLTFTTYGRTSNLQTSTSGTRNTTDSAFGAGGGAAFGLGGFFPGGITGLGFGGGAGFGANSSSLRVTTATERSRDVAGTRAQIYGRVRINFKTDYAPLNQAPAP